MKVYNFWKKESLTKEQPIWVADYDILGTGSQRFSDFLKLIDKNDVHLLTHPRMISDSVRDFYNLELESFRKKFPRLQIDEALDFDFLAAQKELFETVFPQTFLALGPLGRKIIDNYQSEVAWDSWLLLDYWRYFVGFLRMKFPDQLDLVGLAHWEWVYAWVQVQPFHFTEVLESGIVEVNPSLQTVLLNEDLDYYQKEKGLYAFWYSPAEDKVEILKLTMIQAFYLDLLNEDRKYTEAQLVEMAKINLTPKTELTEAEFFLLLKSDLEALFKNNLLMF